VHLTNLGLNENDARTYENRVKEGGILLAVPIKADDDSDEVEDLLEQNNATDIKTVNN
jgi:hypothetical protein